MSNQGVKPTWLLRATVNTAPGADPIMLLTYLYFFPVTLYANLGDDAIAHGLNQTEVTHVITTHELLPKFKSVLAKTPTVKIIIFIEDQIHQTDRTGYKEGVQILSFNEVAEKGKTSR